MPYFAKLMAAFFASAAVAFLSYHAISLMLDPYNVVWNREVMDYAAYVPEQFRYHKTEELRHDRDRYDTVLLGNSRAFDPDTRLLDHVLDRQLFNYSASSDYPAGYSLKIAWLAKTQKRLKEVILVLWFDQFQMTGTNYDVLLAREHPLVSGESWLSYYWAFSELPFETVRNLLVHYGKSLLGLPRTTTKLVHNAYQVGTGDYIYSNPDPGEIENLRRRYEQRLASEKAGAMHFRTSSLTAAEQNYWRKYFATSPIQEIQRDGLRDSIDVLKRSNLAYKCVVPPMNANVVSWVTREKYLEWIRFVLDTCGEVWDFALPNDITKDNFNYNDWSHFARDVSHLAMLKVLGGTAETLKTHPGFGQLLTRSDGDLYASMLEAALAGRSNTVSQ